MTEWDEDKILNLIEIYKDKPVIWNPKNKNYYRKHLKLVAWSEIGAAIGKTGEECKRKMIIILASWRREKVKEKNSLETGKGGDEVYQSKWFAYSALDFLKDRDVPKKGLQTKDNTNNEANNINQNAEAMHTYKILEPSPKKAKPDPKLEMIKEAFGILKNAAEKPAAAQQLNVENPELRTFCDFIFQKMKNYNPQIMNSVQQEIMQIIFRADHANYNYTYYFDNLPHAISNYQQASTPQTPLSMATDVTENSNYNQKSYVSVASHLGHSSVYQQTATTSSLATLPPVTPTVVTLPSVTPTLFSQPPPITPTFVSSPAVSPSSVNSYSPSYASPSPQSLYSDMEDLV